MRALRTAGHLVVSSSVASALIAAPQTNPQQLPTYRAGTQLVQADVVVLDDAGRPVHGLTATDFTILDHGAQRAIASFAEIVHARTDNPDEPRPPADVRSDVSDNSSTPADALVILVIDDLNIWKDRVELVKRLGRQVVEGLSPRAPIAVLFTSGHTGLEPTTDRAPVLEAIARMSGQYHAMRVRTGCTAQDVRGCYVFKQIQDAAHALSGLDARRKAFILISEGQGIDLHGLFESMSARTPLNEMFNMKYVAWHDYALLDMMDALRHANATLYTVDPRGRLQTTEERSHESRGESARLKMQDPLYWSQEGLQLMAAASGGFGVVDTNDLSAGIARIVDDLDSYYVVGFYSADPEDKRWHPIEVRVNRPAVSLRHRKGYFPFTKEPRPRPTNPSQQLAAAAVGVLPQAGIPVRLFAVPLQPTRDRLVKVALVAEVKGAADRLLASDGRVRDDIRFETIAVDLRKKKAARAIGYDLSIAAAPLRDGLDMTYQASVAIELAPGNYQLRTSIRSRALGETGSVYLSIQVPDLGKGLAIAGPVIGLTDASSPPSNDPGGVLPFRPVLSRSFQPSDVLRCAYGVFAKTGRDVASVLEVVDQTDRVSFRAERPASTDGRMLDVEIPMHGHAPGGYILRVSADANGTSIRREIGFVIRGR